MLLMGCGPGVAYTVSKHGLIGLTKNTAAFYASKGIRCNAIAAGAMKTNIANEFAQGGLNMEGYMTMKKTCTYIGPENGKYRGKTHHIVVTDDGVFVETEKVAKLVSYVCSDAGEIINGAILTADAATTAN